LLLAHTHWEPGKLANTLTLQEKSE